MSIIIDYIRIRTRPGVSTIKTIKYHCYDCGDNYLGTCRMCTLNLTVLVDNNHPGLVSQQQLCFASFLQYLLLVPLQKKKKKNRT